MADPATSRRAFDASRFPPQTPLSPDQDTCRICRSESSPEEPLFYPCKCSGSIKYVHQNCLMEWLSHSQKKHCELCKTPFRFTKLYSPSMPKSLPVHVFVGHMAKHLAANLLVWLRALVVVSVWLGWLPYLMRSIWAFYFWLSDHGFGSAPSLSIDAAGAYRQPYSGKLPATCASSPLHATQTTDVRALVDTAAFGAAGPHLHIDVTADSVSNAVIKLVFGSLQSWFSQSLNAITIHTHSYPTLRLSSSLLADASFFRNMTRWPAINSTAVVVAEGWIITAVVVVCFILIILVRDYVVQQQPEINMRAAFAGQNDAPPLAGPEIPHLNDADNEAREEPADDEARHAYDRPSVEAPTADAQSPIRQAHLEGISRPRSASETYESRPQYFGADTAQYAESLRQNPSFRAGSAPSRPVPLASEPLGTATSDTASVSEFLALWREAKCDRHKFLLIVEERHLEARMAPWIINTESFHAKQASVEGELGNGDAGTNDKGKEAVRDGQPEHPRVSYTWDDHAGSSSRGRSISEVPSPNATMSFLGNNTWSFDSIKEIQNVDGDKAESSTTASHVPDLSEPAHDNVSVGRTEDSDDRERNLGSSNDSLAADAALLAPENHDEAVLPGPNARQPLARPPHHAGGFVGRIVQFMFADLDAAEGRIEAIDFDNGNVMDDEDDSDDDNDDDDFPVGEDGELAQDDEPDVIEDLEDFEGVMELIGMRGPIAGLFQNAIFCAVLVSVTIFLCVFLPYNIGRVSVWVMANPSSLARMLLEFTRLIQDCTILLLGCCAWMTLFCTSRVLHLAGFLSTDSPVFGHTLHFREISTSALLSIWDMIVQDLGTSVSDMQNFSAMSHVALLQIKAGILSAFSQAFRLSTSVSSGNMLVNIADAVPVTTSALGSVRDFAYAASAKALNPSQWVISLGTSLKNMDLDQPELTVWSTVDRVWVIIIGYLTVAGLAAWYLRRNVPLSGGQAGQQWEASIVDMLNQASGVVKVILIIGIEMLIFPLYCGLLLDAALLPLFANATFASRVLFTYNYPITSAFVHWFVGTGYMFHFALFVSMCRKIMRRGVLYFIRDPDDPDFHPVRDVLERSLMTQLRKILFSALVYGGLVIICLGGVVWGLWYAMPDVLPIHYSSNEPVLEFPIDLLFYNFVMPLAVRFFKPTNSLHTMYTWWFRTCARALRLTWFLFRQRCVDEEGTLFLHADSPYRRLPWWRTFFLKVDVEANEVVPMSWQDLRQHNDAAHQKEPTSGVEHPLQSECKQHLASSGQLVRSGRFVLAPASDQVKILRGMKVFHQVDDVDPPRDAQDAQASPGAPVPHSDYEVVYIPPNFGTRIFLFILFMWLFAAGTGVALTILPLLFGRRMFKVMLPGHIRTNDIYAFSIGTYTLGSALYVAFHSRAIASKASEWARAMAVSWLSRDAPRRLAQLIVRGAKLAYVYFALLIVLPLLLAALMELYVQIPVHTLMNPPIAHTHVVSGRTDSKHTIRLIQTWTLGVLYLKLVSRIINELSEDSRLAMAIRAVMRHGWLRPNVSLFTRAFLVPGVALGLVAIFGPALVTRELIARGVFGRWTDDPVAVVLIHRAAYPMASILVIAGLLLWNTIGVFNRWTVRIRDEAYLIGERLHNFGVASAATGKGKASSQWGAAGARL